MSVGHRIAVEKLGMLPDNFIVQNAVPQLELLQRTKVFITHAGMNSASEALYYGVPLLAIPQATDQHYVAKRVAQLGAGKVLAREKVTAPLLRKYVGEFLAKPGYAQESARIGETLRQAGGYVRAVDEIESMKQRLGIR
jgi:MGT family glycosyltransferase